MAGKGDAFELDVLKLIFNATAIANLADNAGTGPLTNLYVSLHTADPTDGGDQTSSEVAYTSYARVAVARTTGGWTCATAAGVSTAKNAGVVTFPTCTGGSSTATYVGVGTALNGTGKLLYAGALTNSVVISLGNPTSSFAIGDLSVSED